MAPRTTSSKKATASKSSAAKTSAKKAATSDNPREAEQVTEAEAGVQREDAPIDEVRVGLATGSHAGNPDIPDKLPINQTVEGIKPDEPTTANLSVAVTSEGKAGPAAD